MTRDIMYYFFIGIMAVSKIINIMAKHARDMNGSSSRASVHPLTTANIIYIRIN